MNFHTVSRRLVLIVLFFSLSLVQCSRSEVKMHSIAVINYSPAGEPSLGGLKSGMEKYGYKEKENIRYIYNGVIEDKDKLGEELENLLAEKPDLIFAISTPAALEAKLATETSRIPVVFAPVSSPVQAGVVDSMSHPGGNLTGVTFGPQEPRRLEMLTRIDPGARRIYVPFNPGDTSPVLGVERLKPEAERLGLTLVLEELRNREEVLKALGSLRTDIDALFLPTDSMMVDMTEDFARLAEERKIPLTCPQKEGVSQGALFSYGFSIADTGYQAARIVDQIFNGIKPEDIPVELSEFTLTVNMDTAGKIGLDIPEEILSQAKIIRD